jgi:hypothetical protein
VAAAVVAVGSKSSAYSADGKWEQE